MAQAMIVYQLSDPVFTIYHRAALGGLAATVHMERAESARTIGLRARASEWGRNMSDSHGDSVDVYLILISCNDLLEREHRREELWH